MKRLKVQIQFNFKAIMFISLMLLSSVFMFGQHVISSNQIPVNKNNDDTVNELGSSFADLNRPTFLEPGMYLNYSFSCHPYPAATFINFNEITNISGSLVYTVNSVNQTYYDITENSNNIQVKYGGSNGNDALMGLYNISINRSVIEDDVYRGYTTSGPINSSFLNITNISAVPPYNYSTNMLISVSNNTLFSATGDQVNAITVDSNLTSDVDRVKYFAHYRTLLSYYKNINILSLDPDELYETNLTSIGFSYNGEDLVSTNFIGDRPAVRYTRSLTSPREENLYFDKYTGILLKLVIYIDKYPLENAPVHEITYDLVGSNVNFTRELPFEQNEFNDAIKEIMMYLHASALNDTNNSLFFPQTSGNGSSVSNYSKYASDSFKILYGFEHVANGTLDELLYELNKSKLHDNANGSFFHSMINNVPDGNKTISDAAWAILGSMQFGSSVASLQQEIFDFMETLYVKKNVTSTFYGFARTKDELSGNLYAHDNLLAILALQKLALYHPNNTLATKAAEMAYNVSKLFYSDTSADHFWDSTNGLFYTSIQPSGFSANNAKSTRDAALAIQVLCDAYLYNQTGNAGLLDRANETLSILLDHLWNKMDFGFIHDVDSALVPNDANRTLEDNTLMLMALIDLFQAINLKNGTNDLYFHDVAYDTWSFIVSRLHDDENHTFISSTSDNTVRSGELGLLLAPLATLSEFAQSTTLTLSINDTDQKLVYENQSRAQVKAKWLFKYQKTLPQSDINLQIPLEYADINYYFRYNNGTQYAKGFNITNPSGEASFVFSLPNPPSFDEHKAYASANKSGFVPKSTVLLFRVECGVHVFQVNEQNFNTDFIEGENSTKYPAVYPGETFSMMLNFSSQIASTALINATLESDGFENTSTILTVNAGQENQTFHVNMTVFNDTTIGFHSFFLKISKNDSVFASLHVNYYVKMPFFINDMSYPSYIDNGRAYNLSFNVKNLNPNVAENLSITFSSLYLEIIGSSNTFNFTAISPSSQVSINITYRLKQDSPILSLYEFHLEMVRNGQNISTLRYNVEYRPIIEVIEISGPQKPLQNRPFLFSAVIENNYLETLSIQVKVFYVEPNGNEVLLKTETLSLEPGENKIFLDLSNQIISPWEIGLKEYRIKVYDPDGNKVSIQSIKSDVQVSLENAIIGYVSIFAAIGIIFLYAFYKRRQIEMVRR
ncbi:MAG: hypothetical protein ACTSVI_04430 [Promethearchaeota archaeon]